MKIISLVLLFLCLNSNAQNTIRVEIGELTTPVVGPLLQAFAADRLQSLSQMAETEVTGKKSGMKFTATLSRVEINGLFSNASSDRYSIAIGNNGVIALDLSMPDVEITGRLHLEARPKKAKHSGGIFGAFDPTGIIDAISDTAWNIAGTQMEVDHSYRVSSKGIRLGIVMKVDVTSNQVTILSSKISKLKVGDTLLDLKSSRDGIVAQLANAFSFGSIDAMIEDMILDQLSGRRIAERMAEPINNLIAGGLRIPITHTFDVSPDVAIAGGRELDANEMRVLVPFALIEEFAENLSQKENIVFSREKWGVRMTASKSGVIHVRPGTDNEIIWQVPVDVELDSSRITGLKMSATVEARVRPSAEGDTFNMEVVGGRIAEVNSWPFQYGRPVVAWVLNRAFENRIKQGFPKTMIATNLPVMENLDWRVNDLRVSQEGVTITGSLVAKENIVAPAIIQTSSGPRQACASPLLRMSPNNRVMVYKFRRGKLM